MKIPEQIKIGGHMIAIQLLPKGDLPIDAWGEYRMAENRIRIQDNLPESQTSMILLHEVIEWLSGANELNIEHPKIQCLSEALFQVLRDNDLHFYEQPIKIERFSLPKTGSVR